MPTPIRHPGWRWRVVFHVVIRWRLLEVRPSKSTGTIRIIMASMSYAMVIVHNCYSLGSSLHIWRWYLLLHHWLAVRWRRLTLLGRGGSRVLGGRGYDCRHLGRRSYYHFSLRRGLLGCRNGGFPSTPSRRC